MNVEMKRLAYKCPVETLKTWMKDLRALWYFLAGDTVCAAAKSAARIVRPKQTVIGKDLESSFSCLPDSSKLTLLSCFKLDLVLIDRLLWRAQSCLSWRQQRAPRT